MDQKFSGFITPISFKAKHIVAVKSGELFGARETRSPGLGVRMGLWTLPTLSSVTRISCNGRTKVSLREMTFVGNRLCIVLNRQRSDLVT